MKVTKVVAVLAAVVAFSGTVFASNLTDLLVSKGIITSSDAQTLTADAGGASSVPAWVQNMKFSGSMRLRYQGDWAQNASTRDRMRLRLLFGVETNPIENMSVAFGLATGSLGQTGSGITDSNAATRNYTFSDFDKPTIMVDFAYIQYKIIDGVKITGGKVKGDTALYNLRQLVWDGNINPDGVALNVNEKIGSSFEFFGNAGWYTLGEGNSSGKTYYNPVVGDTLTANGQMPDVYVVQPGVTYKSDLISAKVAVAYQQFNTKGRMVFANDTLSSSYLVTNSINNINYNIIDPSGELRFKNLVGKYGVSIFGEYVKNINSEVKNNAEGGLYGIGIGNDGISKFADWNLSVAGRYLMSNAVPNGMSFSDVYGGTITNGVRGYEASLNFGLTKNSWATISYLNYKNINGATVDKSLGQFDINYKF